MSVVLVFFSKCTSYSASSEGRDCSASQLCLQKGLLYSYLSYYKHNIATFLCFKYNEYMHFIFHYYYYYLLINYYSYLAFSPDWIDWNSVHKQYIKATQHFLAPLLLPSLAGTSAGRQDPNSHKDLACSAVLGAAHECEWRRRRESNTKLHIHKDWTLLVVLQNWILAFSFIAPF